MHPSSTLCLLLMLLSGVPAFHNHNQLRARQLEALKGRLLPQSVTKTDRKEANTLTFSNPRVDDFYVDGATIPEVNFDVGPSYAGLLPISGDENETRQLFFWFFPPAEGASLDDLIFWTNGGPGCSSLKGLLQENGPFSWSFGQAKPTPNEYSWTKLSSVLWVEQPVGTGYSQGEPSIKNEDDLAAQLVGFLQQFLEVFEELKGKNLYLTGESYAGTYIPYIANYIYNHNDALPLTLRGIWMANPALSYDLVQTQIPAVEFVHKFENVFALNQTTLASLDETAERCGYAGYISKYIVYPPKGPLPLPNDGTDSNVAAGCDVWEAIYLAVLLINPAFSAERIFDTYPTPWDVLGFPGSSPEAQTTPVYFDRADVKKVIHAPYNVNWEECVHGVFQASEDVDQSLPPAFTVLPSVIEKSDRTVIIHGMVDFLLISDGTRIIIQNMTWAGLQGFRTPILKDSFIVDDVGALGTAHVERKLAYVEVALSGHMVPQFSPKAAFQTMQYLLGKRETP